MKINSIQRMAVSALLIAIGIVIPMFSPVRFVLEPASFTLASHVAIFIAMMIHPGMAVTVALGTTLGFFIGGFPLVVVLRAATHVVFACVGAFYLKKRPATLESPMKTHIFSLLIGVLHALCEVAVVSVFFFGGNVAGTYYEKGFLFSVILLVGVGGIIHSMVDFEIALVIVKALSKQRSFAALQKAH